MRFAVAAFATAFLFSFTACEKHPLPQDKGVKAISEQVGGGHGEKADAHGEAKPEGEKKH